MKHLWGQQRQAISAAVVRAPSIEEWRRERWIIRDVRAHAAIAGDFRETPWLLRDWCQGVEIDEIRRTRKVREQVKSMWRLAGKIKARVHSATTARLPAAAMPIHSVDTIVDRYATQPIPLADLLQ